MKSPSPTKPKRIQLRRTKGWKMPPNTVKVDRTTKWGNPFVAKEWIPRDDWRFEVMEQYARIMHPGLTFTGLSRVRVGNRAEALALFDFSLSQSIELLHVVPELRGKNLACWCKPGEPCHADVLMEIANP